MTKQEILDCSITDLPQMAGDIMMYYEGDPPMCCDGRDCGCRGLPVDRPDPIPLTWDNAMKWRDRAVEYEEQEYIQAMWEVYYTQECNTKVGIVQWLTTLAQPHHHIRAAMLCELRSKK